MDYEQCVGIVTSAEAYDTQPRFAEVNIVDLGASVAIKEYDPEDASKILAFIDSVEVALIPQEKPASGTKAVVKESRGLIKKVMEAEAIGAKAIRSQSDVVVQELNAIIGAAGGQFKINTSARGGKKLVLVTLSMPDQIGELEKISAGLDGRAYSDEELAIIRTEVGGLARNRSKPSDDFQRSLASIRDSRLKEVMDKLGM